MKLIYLFPFVVINCVFASISLQGTFKKGLELLSQLVKPDNQFSSVFENLQERFSQNREPPKGEEDEGTSSTWSNILKIFGMRSDQAPVAGINLLLFLAQIVSNAFTSDSETTKPKKHKSLLHTLMDQPKISRLLSTMENPKLGEIALQEIESNLPSQSDCLLQLFCRTFPIIKGMQNSLNFFLNKGSIVNDDVKKGEDDALIPDELFELKLSWKNKLPIERLFFFMPSLADFQSAGLLCKQKYNNC